MSLRSPDACRFGAGSTVARVHPLELELQTQLRKSGGHFRRRREPGPACYERLVVTEDRVRVQQIVDIDADRRSRAANLEDLSESDVDLVDAIAVQQSRLHDVDRGVRSAAREISPELRRDDAVGDGVIRGQSSADTS